VSLNFWIWLYFFNYKTIISCLFLEAIFSLLWDKMANWMDFWGCILILLLGKSLNLYVICITKWYSWLISAKDICRDTYKYWFFIRTNTPKLFIVALKLNLKIMLNTKQTKIWLKAILLDQHKYLWHSKSFTLLGVDI